MSNLKSYIEDMLSLDVTAPEMEFEKKWWTWGDLKNVVDKLDQELLKAGYDEGARIGVLLRNRPEFVPVIICLIKSGRCIVTLNAVAPDDKLADDIRETNVPVIIGLQEDISRPAVIQAAISSSTDTISLPDGFKEDFNLVAAKDKSNNSIIRPLSTGIAIEMLSSGTTGKPKRIPLKMKTFEKALLGAIAFEKGRSENDPPKLRNGVQIVSAPFAHIAGITGVMNSIMAGRKFCLLEKFKIETFCDAVVRHKPKVAGAPPAALKMIYDANVSKEIFSSLVAFRSGTAPLDPHLVDAFLERYEKPVLQNYGATEFAGGVAGWTLDDFRNFWKEKWASVGRINKNVDAHVIDSENHSVLASGQEGLLELRADHINNGEWVRTTDLAVVDDDRFLWIKGRFDNAIIRGGFKVFPDDIVKALEKHEAIREASVTAIDDSRLGEVPVAAYIRKTGAAVTSEDELKGFLRKSLMPYQLPVIIREMEKFPRTPSMKVSLPQLKELFVQSQVTPD